MPVNRPEIKIPIVVIAGPTGSGKSEIALRLAKKYKGSVINADSRQVYKEIGIGTDKPLFDSSESNLIDGVPHFLYDYISIFEDYSVKRYQADLLRLLIEDSNLLGRVVFITGGTGLYIDSVLFGYDLQKGDLGNKEIDLRKELGELSNEELKKRVGETILDKMNWSDQNNPRRLIRMIEKKELNLDIQSDEISPTILKYLYLVIERPKETLEQNIKQRIEKMFSKGLESEAGRFKDEIIGGGIPALQSIGYQEFAPYFSADSTLQSVKDQIYIHTRQYIKRQITWFKRNKECVRIGDYVEADQRVESFLQTV